MENLLVTVAKSFYFFLQQARVALLNYVRIQRFGQFLTPWLSARSHQESVSSPLGRLLGSLGCRDPPVALSACLS